MNSNSSLSNYQGLTIRPFMEQDRSTLIQYWLDLDLHVMSQLGDTKRFKKNSQYAKYITNCLSQYQSNPDSIVLVGEYQDFTSGFIVAHKLSTPLYQEKTIGMIGACYVQALYRRRGLARQLVQEVNNWFRDAQISYIDVVWDKGNREAEQFWTALGFKPSQIKAHIKLS